LNVFSPQFLREGKTREKSTPLRVFPSDDPAPASTAGTGEETGLGNVRGKMTKIKFDEISEQNKKKSPFF